MFFKKSLILVFLLVFMLGSSVFLSGCTREEIYYGANCTYPGEWGCQMLEDIRAEAKEKKLEEKRAKEEKTGFNEYIARRKQLALQHKKTGTTVQKKSVTVAKPAASAPKQQDLISPWLKKAKTGDSVAQFQLGILYAGAKTEAGNTLSADQQNDKKAAHWFYKAARQQHAPSQAWLGFLYEQGRGIEKNISYARYWYRDAAAQGDAFSKEHLQALNALPTLQIELKEGQDRIKTWLPNAKTGSFVAQNNLARLYMGEMDVQNYLIPTDLQDDKKAIYWFKKAANQGDYESQRALGYLYENGRGEGTKKEVSKALYWYKKAAAQGDTYAKERVAVLQQ